MIGFVLFTLAYFVILKLSKSGEGYSPIFGKENFYNSFSYKLDENNPEDLVIIKKLIKHQLSARVYSGSYSTKANSDDLRYIMFKDHYDCGKMFEMASNSQSNTLRIASDMIIQPQSRSHGLNAGKSADSLRQMVINKYKIDLETLTDVVEVNIHEDLS